ncbi:trypsin-like peptidase domain-containing protein [Arthrobacter ipis]|uniref:trypsin-like peptidase domain-containing protein n=1 Tax=Arthrobacter ipis TaxID=2716202 RepID=UPI00202B0217|nr:trypsin-like peptidase domain-containing protein [Arthrobacter ipis]
MTGCTGNQQTPATSPGADSPTVQGSQNTPTQTTQGTRPPGSAADIPAVIQNVQPSVVTVFTQDGLGSGVVYAADGLILTNEHVVRGNTNVEVAFADGRRVPGKSAGHRRNFRPGARGSATQRPPGRQVPERPAPHRGTGDRHWVPAGL